jgi:hypothetical protein
MAWTTILSSQTDADSPLNQVLMDSIRDNLNYVKAQTDALFYIQLGGYGIEFTGPQVAQAVVSVEVGHFDLPAAPSGYKWQLELKCQGYKSAGTIDIEFQRRDHTQAVVAYVNSANLGASYIDYDLLLATFATAAWGSLSVRFHSATTGTACIRSAVTRAYLVAA